MLVNFLPRSLLLEIKMLFFDKERIKGVGMEGAVKHY